MKTLIKKIMHFLNQEKSKFPSFGQQSNEIIIKDKHLHEDLSIYVNHKKNDAECFCPIKFENGYVKPAVEILINKNGKIYSNKNHVMNQLNWIVSKKID